jgi:hypothetical protein
MRKGVGKVGVLSRPDLHLTTTIFAPLPLPKKVSRHHGNTFISI